MEQELRLTQEQIDAYLNARTADGLPAGTATNYRRKLQLLYELLPEDKTIRPGTLLALANRLEAEGYSIRTVNVFLSVADGMLAYFEQYGLQAHDRREVEASVQPELTRAEYLRLLSAAKLQDKPKAYFLIKTFATLGVNTTELCLVTVEAVRDGYLRLGEGLVRIPDGFRSELQQFARREGIDTGPIFITRNGKPLQRTYCNTIIAAVQKDARVAPEKCNPSSLRRLYQKTQAELQARMQLLIEQEYERMLALEDYSTGWNSEPERTARKTQPRAAWERGRVTTTQGG